MSEGKRRRVLSVREGSRSIKIPAQLSAREWDMFAEAARAEGRSVTRQVSWLIRRFLKGPSAQEPWEAWPTRIEPVIRIRSREEVRDDEEMRAYWLTRPPEERVAEAERLRRMASAIRTGLAAQPGIALVGKVVRGAR